MAEGAARHSFRGDVLLLRGRAGWRRRSRAERFAALADAVKAPLVTSDAGLLGAATRWQFRVDAERIRPPLWHLMADSLRCSASRCGDRPSRGLAPKPRAGAGDEQRRREGPRRARTVTISHDAAGFTD
jgi:hypothetical protein